MSKVCQKKFPLLKRKNGFFAFFVILAKSQKWPFCWGGYGTQNFSLKGWYRTLLSKMTLAGSNIGVCRKYRKPFLTKITHRKIVRKGTFHENWYFWHCWAKNWKNGRYTKVGFFRFCPFFLIESKSIENTKKLSPQMIKVCWKKFPP